MNFTLTPDRKRAVIATIIFHVLLIMLFMIFGLMQPDPLPEDTGASMELGWVETSSGDGGTPTPTTPENTTPPPVETPVVEQEAISQEEESIAIPEEPEEKPQETKPEEQKPAETVPEEQKPSEEFTNAESNVFNSTPGDPGDGEDPNGDPGDTGNPDGTPNGHGVMGGTGNSWNLSGRGYVGGAVVAGKPIEEGKVVLKIWVDNKGNVIRTSVDLANSINPSAHLRGLAEKAAKKAKFTVDPSAAAEQRGTMTFVFKLE